MASDTLAASVDAISSAWGPLSTEVVDACQRHLANLLKAPETEEWLSVLHKDAPASRQLHRDPQHGFVLLAHTEHAGLYRPPHDHGRSWVIYAVQQGEIEMGTYGRIENPDGSLMLVKRNSTVVRPGQVQLYLPGDIHDTRCLTQTALLFRFTERDLQKEDKEEHRVTRYVQRNGHWTTGAP
ncbi:MAG: hypothetical protein ABIP38_02470 [Steroidobacteraceae bacterium]